PQAIHCFHLECLCAAWVAVSLFRARWRDRLLSLPESRPLHRPVVHRGEDADRSARPSTALVPIRHSGQHLAFGRGHHHHDCHSRLAHRRPARTRTPGAHTSDLGCRLLCQKSGHPVWYKLCSTHSRPQACRRKRPGIADETGALANFLREWPGTVHLCALLRQNSGLAWPGTCSFWPCALLRPLTPAEPAKPPLRRRLE